VVVDVEIVALPERLPAASTASTRSVYVVPQVRLETVYVRAVVDPTSAAPFVRP
jgi:hypothetical protein